MVNHINTNRRSVEQSSTHSLAQNRKFHTLPKLYMKHNCKTFPVKERDKDSTLLHKSSMKRRNFSFHEMNMDDIMNEKQAEELDIDHH